MYPSDGEIPAVLAVVALILCRKIFLGWNPRALLNPVFMMMVLGWLLGLKMRRFWWDFGTPAFMVWVALELQEHFENHLSFDSARRLLVTLGIAAGVFLGFTSDRESRWTANLTTEYITPETPGIAGWLPGDGGIIYNSDMDVFFQTFFKNPSADWRYILGFESGLMRPGRFGNASQNPVESRRGVRGLRAVGEKNASRRPDDPSCLRRQPAGHSRIGMALRRQRLVDWPPAASRQRPAAKIKRRWNAKIIWRGSPARADLLEIISFRPRRSSPHSGGCAR